MEANVIQNMVSSAKTGTGSDVWYTPQDILDSVKTIFGKDFYDPFPRDWDGTVDGYTSIWPGDAVFINPPYSDLEKAIDAGIRNRKLNAYQRQIWLIPSRTDTKAFHKAFDHASYICFVKGRVSFLNPEKPDLKQPALFPSCFLYMGPLGVSNMYIDRFIEAFSSTDAKKEKHRGKVIRLL